MTLEEAREVLKNKMFQIGQMEVLQSEKSKLVFDALEVYRKEINRINRPRQEAERKRLQDIMDQFKKDKKANDTKTKKIFLELRKNQTREHLKTLVGTEKFQEFVEKFGGKKNED